MFRLSLFRGRTLSRFKNAVVRYSQSTVDFRDYTVSEIKVEVPGGVIAGKLWEPNKPLENLKGPQVPVICTHGWLDNAGTFDTLLPLLVTSSSPKFLAFDLPGHGLTTYCPQWFYDGHVEGVISIRRLMREFGWDKVTLLGHSMGGIINFIFTSLYPEDVHKLICLENMRPLQHNPLRENLRAAINLVFEVEERDTIPRKSYKYEELLQRFYQARQETIGLEGCKALLKRGLVPVPPVDNQEEDERFTYSYNFRTLIPGQEGRYSRSLCNELATHIITTPTCFVKAEPGNVYETEEDVKPFFDVLEKNLKGDFEKHRVPGNHHFHLDEPLGVAGIIKKFLIDS